jgi:creatinine amidohydrolase
MTSLVDLTSPEVDRGHLLIVPLGATEQHGPHLPLGTDTAIAVALAEAATERVAGAVVAPALAYGSSGEHQDFAGTLSIGAVCTELVLVELGRSATETFDRVLFLNGHGGNVAPLAAAVARLREEGRDVCAWSPRLGGDAHAGHTETSLMLALAPESVREGRAPGNTAPLATLIGDLQVRGVRDVAPDGVLGDPTDASTTEGGRLLAAAVDDLRAMLAAWSVGATAR